MDLILKLIKQAERQAKEATEHLAMLMELRQEISAVMKRNDVLEERCKKLYKQLKYQRELEDVLEENVRLRQRINQLNEHIQWQQQTTTTN